MAIRLRTHLLPRRISPIKLTRNLIAAWRFDRGIFTDVAAQQTVATITGSAAGSGSPFGRVWDCGSGANYFTVNRTAGTIPTTDQPFTFANVIYVVDNSNAAAHLQYGQVTDGANDIGISVNNSGQLTIDSATAPASPLTVTSNQWTFCGVSQVAATQRTFFVNGTFLNDTNNTGAGNACAGGIVLGATFTNAAVGNVFVGKIALSLVWSRALQNPEIEYLYSNPMGPWIVFAAQSRGRKRTRVSSAAPVGYHGEDLMHMPFAQPILAM